LGQSLLVSANHSGLGKLPAIAVENMVWSPVVMLKMRKQLKQF
jgi:hypothetical protein